MLNTGAGAFYTRHSGKADFYIKAALSETGNGVALVLIEMVRTLAFDQVLQLSESGEPVPPKFIKELAIGVEKLEKAASESTKREKEIRKTMAEEAAEQAATIASSQGMTAEGVDLIKRQILGIA